jgi:hypothetical protein
MDQNGAVLGVPTQQPEGEDDDPADRQHNGVCEESADGDERAEKRQQKARGTVPPVARRWPDGPPGGGCSDRLVGMAFAAAGEPENLTPIRRTQISPTVTLRAGPAASWHTGSVTSKSRQCSRL